MKKEDAYSVLGLSSDASEDEVKKKYREMSKKYHPDVNKSPNADQEFKKINEAHDRIKNNNFEDNQPPRGFSGFGGFEINLQDLINFHQNGFSSERQSKGRDLPPVQTSVVISFKESVFGCKKELSFDRYLKCQPCEGTGKILLSNGCVACHGKGKITSQKGNMIFSSTCNKCKGKINTEDCKSCKLEGSVSSNTTISINIPSGISNNTLRLSNIGNYLGNHAFGERYSDVYVHVRVIPENNFSIEGNDVVSRTPLTLLDALQGCTKQIETLDGQKTISVPPLSKNKDEVIIPNLGLARQGNQRVVLQVEYPSDTNQLINYLKEVQ
jgi:molecular chaperone DnaJ